MSIVASGAAAAAAIASTIWTTPTTSSSSLSIPSVETTVEENDDITTSTFSDSLHSLMIQPSNEDANGCHSTKTPPLPTSFSSSSSLSSSSSSSSLLTRRAYTDYRRAVNILTGLSNHHNTCATLSTKNTVPDHLDQSSLRKYRTLLRVAQRTRDDQLHQLSELTLSPPAHHCAHCVAEHVALQDDLTNSISWLHKHTLVLSSIVTLLRYYQPLASHSSSSSSSSSASSIRITPTPIPIHHS